MNHNIVWLGKISEIPETQSSFGFKIAFFFLKIKWHLIIRTKLKLSQIGTIISIM